MRRRWWFCGWVLLLCGGFTPHVSADFRDTIDREARSRLDALGSRYYTRLLEQISPCLSSDRHSGVCPLPDSVHLTDLRRSVRELVSAEQLANVMQQPLAEMLGRDTAGAVRRRLDTAMAGDLPPELTHALRDPFNRMEAGARRATNYLPGAQLDRLKDKILNTSFLTVPNPVYGAILSESAARHFARAFCGPGCFDAYQFTRGQEVTRVLVWQLAHREAITLSLGQLLDLGSTVADRLHLPDLKEWGNVGRDAARIQAHGKKLEALLHKADALALKQLDDASARINTTIRAFESELQSLQRTLLTPAHTVANMTKTAIQPVAEAMAGRIPERWNGVPPTWEAFKARLHITPWFVPRAPQPATPDPAAGDPPDGIIPIAAQTPAQHESRSSAFDPVLLHNGEFIHAVTDVTIPIRRGVLQFVRVYRSRRDFAGVLGRNWTHNFAERLTPATDRAHTLVWQDPHGRLFRFARHADGAWQSPRGVFALLHEVGEHLVLRLPDGETRVFADGRLVRREDAFGNAVRLHYDANQRLVSIADPAGRRLRLQYDSKHRLVQLRDWKGRAWRYQYDAAGDLVRVTGPGTADFPDGIATRYTYSTGFADPALNHNLTQIIDPRGQRFLRNAYGQDGMHADRVVAQWYGEQERPIRATYTLVRPGWWSGVNTSVNLVSVIDRRGNERRYEHNAFGELLRETWINRKGRSQLIAAYRYDTEGRLLQTSWPDGRTLHLQYDRAADRRMGANVVRKRERARDGAERRWHAQYQPGTAWLREVVDPLGRRTRYLYNQHALREVQQGDRVVTLTHDAHGQLVESANAGVQTRWTYTANGDVLQVVRDAAGIAATTRYRHDAVGNIVAVTDPEGHTTQLVVNARDQVTRRTNPLGTEIRYTYDANDNLAQIAIGRGRDRAVTTFAYDLLDHLVRERALVDDARWIETRYTYDANDNLRAVRFPEGNRVEYRYDAMSRPVTVIRPAGGGRSAAGTEGRGVWRFRYDAAGRLTRRTDPLGHAVRYRYDGFGALARVTDPLGNRRTLARDAIGRVIGQTWHDARGRTMRAVGTTYDAHDRPVALHEAWWRRNSAKAVWQTQHWQYDARGLPAHYTDAAGHGWQLQHDGLDRLVEVTDPLGHRQHWQYDRRGLPIAQHRTPPLAETRWRYDAAGRVQTHTDATGLVTQFRYDVRDNLVAVIDPEGKTEQWRFDRLGRRIAHRVRAGQGADDAATTRWVWDDNHRLAALIDPLQQTTRYQYDADNRLVRTIMPDGATHRQQWHPNGLMHSREDAVGNHFAFHYDASSRLTAIAIDRAPGVGGTTRQTFAYDGLGRVRRATDNAAPDDPSDDVQVAWQYDAAGRPVVESTNDVTVANVFDARGLLVGRRWPGAQQSWRYDALGRMVASRDGDATVEWTHTGWQERTQQRFVVGDRPIAEGTRTLDLAGRVQTESVQTATGATWGARYEYDRAGNILQEADQHGQPRWDYAYDGMHRLVRATQHGAQRMSVWQWTLDAAGNWRALTHDAARTEHDITPGNRYREWTYDANGNLVDDGRLHYRYDAFGRLLRVESITAGDALHTYRYDPFWRRVQSDSMRWLHSDWALIGLQRGDRWQRLLRGSELDAIWGAQSDTTAQFVFQDRRSNARLTWDAAGTAGTPQDYAPYGEPLTPRVPKEDALPTGFAGRPQGLPDEPVNLRYRDYLPSAGRFLTPDPLGYKTALDAPTSRASGGSRYQSDPYTAEYAFAAHPAHWHQAPQFTDTTEPNLYWYARNNPLRYHDPSGLLTLHYWDPQGTGMDKWHGHVAITLEDGTYISHWPADNRNWPYLRPSPARPPDRRLDRLGEDGRPPRNIRVDGLNEAAIRQWWDAYDKEFSVWNNCSDVTSDALREGGMRIPPHLMYHPTQVTRDVERLLRVRAEQERRAQTGPYKG